MKKLLMFALLAIVAFTGTTMAATFDIDPVHSSVGFKVKHMVVSNVRGSFGEFEGVIEFDESAPTSGTVSATIAMTSIDTGDAKRDDHLRGADFFDVATHPTMSFVSTGLKAAGDDWILSGDLTLHGVTKAVELELEYNGSVDDPWGNHRIGFTAEGTIDRGDFGITWNNTLDKGGLAVGNTVTVQLEIEAIRQK